MLKIILLIYISLGFLNLISKSPKIRWIIENNNLKNSTLIGGILLMVFAWPILFFLYGDK